MKWELKQLGDLVETLKGFAFKSEWFQKSGIPIVKVKDFTANSISENDLDYISSEKASELQKYALTSDDVIIQTVGSWASNPNSVVGKVICTPKNLDGALLNQNAVKLISAERLNKRFLFYCLRSDDFKGYIIGTAQGAANQASITLEAIRKYTFKLPPLPTQQKIASILSAYDDAIENNLRRIRLLEEAAQYLYREWFVRFRFPGWEEVKVVEGLPEGWERKVIGDVFQAIKGKKPVNEFEEDTPERKLILLVDVLERKAQRFTEDKSLPQCIEGEVVMLMDGSRSGIVFRAIDGLLGSTVGLFRVKKNLVGLPYAFHFFKFREDEIRSKNTGAAIPHANKSYILNMDFLIPSKEVNDNFEGVASAFHKQIETLFRQNQKLKAARDILLPRLMNQTIEV